jgi:hypothetical protein
MNRLPRRVAHAFRRTALPLASYYAVTLAVPLANGAAPSGAFVEHALAVLVVPPVAIVLACTVHTIAHALANACRAAGRRDKAGATRLIIYCLRLRVVSQDTGV